MNALKKQNLQQKAVKHMSTWIISLQHYINVRNLTVSSAEGNYGKMEMTEVHQCTVWHRNIAPNFEMKKKMKKVCFFSVVNLFEILHASCKYR